MKGYKLNGPNKITETEIELPGDTENLATVKPTKALITLSDVLRYKGEIDCKNVVLGSYGIGIVRDSAANLFGLSEGNHVYISPNTPCEECYNCAQGKFNKCLDLLTAAEDYDGFLCDLVKTKPSNLFVLPDSVTGIEALYIGEVALAVTVLDKLGVEKGDYVAVIGTNNFSIILAQLLVYYQAVPILVCDGEKEVKYAKDTGIYYCLDANENLVSEVKQITGGRMAKSAAYILDCGIPTSKAFSIVSVNANVAFTGVMPKSTSVAFLQAIKKQLNISCVNNGFINTSSAINLIANKAINLSKLNIETAPFEDVEKVFEELSKKIDNDEKFTDTIIQLV